MPQRQTGPQTRAEFHRARIGGERSGVRRFWWAAWWVTAELKVLARRDSAAAHAQGSTLADQLIAFAQRLNAAHHEQLTGGRRG